MQLGRRLFALFRLHVSSNFVVGVVELKPWAQSWLMLVPVSFLVDGARNDLRAVLMIRFPAACGLRSRT